MNYFSLQLVEYVQGMGRNILNIYLKYYHLKIKYIHANTENEVNHLSQEKILNVLEKCDFFLPAEIIDNLKTKYPDRWSVERLYDLWHEGVNEIKILDDIFSIIIIMYIMHCVYNIKFL